MTTLALGIDIGGTKIAAALVSPDGQAQGFARISTPTGGADAIFRATIDLGRQVLAAATPHDDVVTVGVGAAGHVDHERGFITYAADTILGWSGAAVSDVLAGAFGLPTVVDNDVNALAVGEHQFGAGRSFQHGLYVAVGTGVGGAVILGGELWRGAHWAAGELGHLVIDWNGNRRCSCGLHGHLEAYAAGPALAARYDQLSNTGEQFDLHAVAARAKDGDEYAQHTITEGAHILGIALGGLLNTLDVQALIIGGGVSSLGEQWWQPLEQALRTHALPTLARVALRRAELGDQAIVVGAAWLALNNVESSSRNGGAYDADRPAAAR
jgi:glucokinase